MLVVLGVLAVTVAGAVSATTGPRCARRPHHRPGGGRRQREASQRRDRHARRPAARRTLRRHVAGAADPDRRRWTVRISRSRPGQLHDHRHEGGICRGGARPPPARRIVSARELDIGGALGRRRGPRLEERRNRRHRRRRSGGTGRRPASAAADPLAGEWTAAVQPHQSCGDHRRPRHVSLQQPAGR